MNDTDPNSEQSTSKELAREFRFVEWAQVITNVVLAIVGIAAVCIYLGQLNQMREATKAAKDSADAAKVAADVSRDTFRLTYRPRLKLLGLTQRQTSTGTGPNHDELDKGRLTVAIDVPNFGPFAARNVRFFRYENISPRDQAKKLEYGEELPGEPKLIPPKAEGGWSSGLIISGQKVLSPEELSGLHSGKLWTTFSILVSYDDDFGETHHAEYCGLFTLQPYNDICPWPVRND